MAELPSIRYSAPARASRRAAWGADWRSRWMRAVGSVHRHHATRQLVAFYSDSRDPAPRLALQAELERRPDGVAEVLAAVDRDNLQFDRFMTRLASSRRAVA